MSDILEGDYKSFNTEDFIKWRFPLLFNKDSCHDTFSEFILKCLAKHFTVRMANASDNSLKILDYGCGPSIGYSISAALKASEIVFADYAPPNREYIKKWLAKDSSAHDWTPYFKYVVQTLEGKSPEAVVQRKEMLRNKVKAVVHCDLSASENEIIEKGFGGPYDIVMSFLVLESICCSDISSFKCAIKKSTSLLKEGGYLLLCSLPAIESLYPNTYVVNDRVYPSFAVNSDIIFESLDENNLSIMEAVFEPFPDKYGKPPGSEILFTASVKKSV